MTDIKPVEHYQDMLGDTLDVWRADAAQIVSICYHDLMIEIQALKAQNEKLETQLGEVCDMIDDMPCDFSDLFPDWKEKYGE